MTMKKRILSTFLALLMLASAAFCGAGAAFASDLPTITMELSDVDQQLRLINSQLSQLKQDASENTWYYTVTDLDHDGYLEFIAASQHPMDRSTNLMVWEVSADRSSLNACSLAKDPEESFPDIMTDCADTFYDASTATWYYLFYDNIVLSDTEVYTIKTGVNLKSGIIDYDAYAIEHTVVDPMGRSVSHTDVNGLAISAEQYNAAGFDAFPGATRSSTNFDWLTADEVDDLGHMTRSFAVFMGVREPTETFPVPRPAALEQPAAQAPASTVPPVSVPAVTAPPAPAPQTVYLSITKNPTSENKTEGGTALFVSCANAFESLTWTLVSPDGGEYSVRNAAYLWPGVAISGESSTTLSISNVSTDMNGWGAYCTFYYKGQTARTTTAYLYVAAKQAPKGAPSGTYTGTVTDWNYSSVTINVAGQATITIPWGVCDVIGDVQYGSSASVVWDGQNVTYCYIQGATPAPQPVYGSMSGTAYHDTAFTVYVVLQNGLGLSLSANLVNIIGGNEIDGASCIVYYTDYPSESTIYQVDIYGYDNYDYGGYAGSHYYDYDYDYEPEYGFPYETGNYVYGLPTHVAYNPDGSTYEAIYCPSCGSEVSLAMEYCPYCGFSFV